MNCIGYSFFALGFLALAACDSFAPTPRPDYTIHVVPGAHGSAVAIPPNCPSWNDALANRFDNQPLPQFGCATARNLAVLVENPNDLVEGRNLASQRSVTAIGAIRRYDNNQTRGLLIPVQETSSTGATTAPTGSSALTGEITTPSTGGGASESSP
ncbi:MAG: CpaD family pilus assembly lipoprotein [Alphaproteobacteria bacterium]|nr:CpaD family pilus assembly lipoprotein [Alphaproteobacteria bacterium]